MGTRTHHRIHAAELAVDADLGLREVDFGMALQQPGGFDGLLDRAAIGQHQGNDFLPVRLGIGDFDLDGLSHRSVARA